MPLQSSLFKGDTRLEAAQIQDAKHIKRGDCGGYVHKIQLALQQLDQANITQHELTSQTYGASTASAVLSYKRKRGIINRLSVHPRRHRRENDRLPDGSGAPCTERR